MKVLFQNHSSLLIKHADRYLLTDPWYNKPAFGSWLPSLTPYIHPTYLAALGDRLTILISHGHDDHFDDKLLEIFDKKTIILTADYKSPSVVNRLIKVGFKNIETIGEDEQAIHGLKISSYIVPEFSRDDATYLIRSESGAVIHANDNWQKFTESHLNIIKARVSGYSKSSVLLFSQTNSASGFPLNYRGFTVDEKQKILKAKVVKMVSGGLQNAASLGLDKMFSYAGFATVYVKGKSYDRMGLFPTSDYLSKLLLEYEIDYPVTIPNLYPGDAVNLPSGEIEKAFVTGYTDPEIKEATDQFYDVYEVKNDCISYRKTESPSSNLEPWIDYFLSQFEIFVRGRVLGADRHYDKLMGKKFSLAVKFGSGKSIFKTVQFGEGLVAWDPRANKICYVGDSALYCILKGEALFEDLYTGYNAEWERFPENEYNRDIVMMMVMFSYVYRNRLSSDARQRFLSCVE